MSDQTCCPVVELRQYTLVSGQRETLIVLFEREFIETQEATGMTVIGQFRDLNNPDSFVWLRGFDDIPTRARALHEFYGGPVWKKHREVANATMIDSDNVLLLRRAHLDSAFRLENAKRPALGTSDTSQTVIVATIYYLAGSADSFADFFETEIASALTKAGASILGTFVTENHPNTFPALPVREGENVFVSFSRFANCEACQQRESSLAGPSGAKQAALIKKAETLLLAPTARSLLR
jgi:hypothetical protein